MQLSLLELKLKTFPLLHHRDHVVFTRIYVCPTLCPYRVRTHQVLLRTHVCVCVLLVLVC